MVVNTYKIPIKKAVYSYRTMRNGIFVGIFDNFFYDTP